MAAEEVNMGRNLNHEVDEIKGRVEAISEGQSRMEELLKQLKDFLHTKGTEGTSGNAGATIQETSAAINHGKGTFINLDTNAGNFERNIEEPNIGQKGDSAGMHFEWEDRPPVKIQLNNSTEREKMRDELMTKMQEQIRAIQGPSLYGPVGIEELCPAAEVAIPKDFKIPDFLKYDGSGNPLFHLKSYCTKMAIWSREEKFLINFFHESLTGPALEWYIQLDHSKISCWRDLTDAFLGQYRFNLDTAPTREQLGGMLKQKDESFKQYAQRWRMLAAQVQPPLTLAEMCSYFLGTLGAPFVGAMAGAAYKDFSDMISAGERIEILAKAGKLPMGNTESDSSKRMVQTKRKEAEVSYVHPQKSPLPRNQPYISTPSLPTYQTSIPHNYPPQASTYPSSPHQINNIVPQRPYIPTRPTYTNRPPVSVQNFPRQTNQSHIRPVSNLPPFPNLSISNADLFQRLFDAHLVAGIPVHPMVPPFPAWYNPNVTCKFHMDVPGHSIEDCDSFKTAVRKLIACKKLNIQEEEGPSIINNPIPNHGRRVNALEIEDENTRNVPDTKVPLRTIFQGLVQAGYYDGLSKECGKGAHCDYHHFETSHDIEDCQEFRAQVQKLMALGVVNIANSSIKEIATTDPFILKVPRVNQSSSSKSFVLTIKKPTPFAYSDTHAVPWKYDAKVETHGSIGETFSASTSKEVRLTQAVSNVVGVGGITRSGRYYSPEEEKDRMDRLEKENLTKGKGKEKEEELLKIMKQSEYDVVEQLKRTPARISVLSLIMSSESHRKALERVLNEAYVKPDVTPENLVNMVDPVKHVNIITFHKEEIVPSTGSNPRALHITLKCKGYVIAKVLIDGGSALNVLPKSTLSQLAMSKEELIPQEMIVRAFDGTKRGILGEVTLPLEIGPSYFQVLFQVMEIEPAYTMLLGRPWIHAAGAVPSTLHQCLKYIENGSLITIRGEEEIMVMKPTSVPYVENTEQEVENFWHSFQPVEPDMKNDDSSSKDVHQVVARIMSKNGYQAGKGLGVQLQGTKFPITLPGNQNKYGLGYESSLEEKMKCNLTLNEEREGEGTRKIIPHLRETFPWPTEIMNGITSHQAHMIINTLDEESEKEQVEQPAGNELLNNWRSEALIDVIAIK